jgi:hypothetical protein
MMLFYLPRLFYRYTTSKNGHTVHARSHKSGGSDKLVGDPSAKKLGYCDTIVLIPCQDVKMVRGHPHNQREAVLYSGFCRPVRAFYGLVLPGDLRGCLRPDLHRTNHHKPPRSASSSAAHTRTNTTKNHNPSSTSNNEGGTATSPAAAAGRRISVGY